jgi:hypothetical protein
MVDAYFETAPARFLSCERRSLESMEMDSHHASAAHERRSNATDINHLIEPTDAGLQSKLEQQQYSQY